MNKYFIVHKPYHVLSQFSSVDGKQTLKNNFDVPSNVYPVGRLDYDSEGLLLLTNDKRLNKLLLDPSFEHEREYWVQIEGEISKQAIDKLEQGVEININGKIYHSKKCLVKRFYSFLPNVSERIPPIRFRKNIPDSWISIVLTEGKNRQVRKMTASVGYPTLRLIRYRIENVTLGQLMPGEMRTISQEEMYNLLKIKKTN
ncbi:MAG: pseudouridine synthase [Ginsengibacter sp.]